MKSGLEDGRFFMGYASFSEVNLRLITVQQPKHFLKIYIK
jgi:hypothetical protein